ncbi:MAG: Polysaccharide biosynthesis protein [uncultured Sulfurovum sp.]|uniref:Polysaccharide biosynthesis protein n=1 Tax=uncultured Sulfurovum sp. TaxID=269237 RepID=A0A6S6UFE1_9BACT|nr:MAG: Polysaccharide biosynthesis protein [uncultured Sulfurovum sp.]
MRRIVRHRMFKSTFVYMATDIINKAIPFLLLPVLTRYLTPSDFGIIASFVTLVSFIGMFTGLNTHGAVSVNYFKESKEKFGIFLSNALMILFGSTLITLFVLFFLQPLITQKFYIPLEWVYVSLLIAASQFITTINLSLWIAEEKPKAYGVFQILQALTLALVTVYLIVVLLMGWEGRFTAVVISAVMFSLFSLRFIMKHKYMRWKFDKEIMVDTLKFGIPLIPHSLGGWLRTGLDRLFLISMIGTAATGIYSVGYQIGMIMGIVVTAFNKVWGPYLFKKLSKEPSFLEKRKLVLFTYGYFVSVLGVAALLSLLSPYLFGFFIDERFKDASPVIGWVAFGYAFTGMYYMVGQYLFYVKKTHYLAMATLITAVLHAIISYTLIKLNGTIGAAQATTISFGINFLVIWYLGNKFYPMPWRLRDVD